MKKLFIISILSCNFLNAQNVFPTTGNVGIGTTTPTEKLEVNTGNIFLNSTEGQFIRWGTPGSAPPSFTTRSAGTKLVLWPGVGAGAADHAIGIENGANWYGIPVAASSHSHKFYAGTSELMRIRGDGNVGIGTANPAEKLHVEGNIMGSDLISGGNNSFIFHTPDDNRKSLHIAPLDNGNWNWGKAFVLNDGNAALSGKFEAKEIKVTTTPTADFVFANDYKLPTLESVEKHIKEKKHLPEIASAVTMEKEGVNIGEFQIKLLQKIEELTLYIIQQNKKIESLEAKINNK